MSSEAMGQAAAGELGLIVRPLPEGRRTRYQQMVGRPQGEPECDKPVIVDAPAGSKPLASAP